MAVAEIFKALGDPIRLEIVKRLTDGSNHTVGSLSKNLGVTRQGARKQIQVLLSADIISLHPRGRETLVELRPDSLDQAKTFIAQIEQQWDARLRALKELLEK